MTFNPYDPASFSPSRRSRIVKFAACSGTGLLLLVLIANFGGLLIRPIGGQSTKASVPPTPEGIETNAIPLPPIAVQAPTPMLSTSGQHPIDHPNPHDVNPRQSLLPASTLPLPTPVPKDITVTLNPDDLPDVNPEVVMSLRTNQSFTVRAVFEPQSDTKRWIEESILELYAVSTSSNKLARMRRNEKRAFVWSPHRILGPAPLCVSVPQSMAPALEQARTIVDGHPVPMMALTMDLENSLFRQLGAALASTHMTISSNMTAVGRLFESSQKPTFVLTELRIPGKPTVHIKPPEPLVTSNAAGR